MESEAPVRVDVTVKQETRLATKDGVFTAILMPGEPNSIPAHALSDAMAVGALPVSGENVIGMTHEEIVESLVEGMQKILDEGKSDLLTASGEPRFSALKARCPEFTQEQRQEAWDIVMASAPTPDGD